MSLWTRLLGLDETGKIGVHTFMAALGEVERGKVSLGTVAAALGLDATEQAEMEMLATKIITPPPPLSLGGFVTLTNVGATYDAIPAAQGLGRARVQTAGITGVEFSVAVNKIGTGTQSWQLWNDTDGTEITVIDDDGATGVKQLLTTETFGAPLGAGVKSIRVRAKSTVAADDPVYFGASVLIQRVERLTSVELHEVLLLGEVQLAYASEAALTARLGLS